MALIPYKPFGDFDRFFEDDDWFLPVLSGGRAHEPAMDLYETEKEVVAELSLPNVNPENVDIFIEDQVLRVQGKAEEKKEEKDKEKGYYRREIRRGAFERAVRLPVPVDEDKVNASYEKGNLKIVMSKAEPKSKARKIKVAKAD